MPASPSMQDLRGGGEWLKTAYLQGFTRNDRANSIMKLPLTIRLSSFSILVAAVFTGAPASAEAPKSLDMVPADVAFYSASLRLREQFDAFVNSNAYAKLKEMPVVQMGMAMLEEQWNSPFGPGAQLKQALEQPENKQLVEVLKDAVSHEIFIYGDEGCADLLQVVNELNSAQQAAQMAALTGGDPEEAMVRGMLEVVNKHLADAKLPDLVIGFRLTDTEPALAQLGRLEQLAGAVLAQQPELQNRFSRKPLAGGDFLSLQLDGSLIPWDQIPPDALSQFEGLQDKITKMTLDISLGVKGEYLILSIGDTNEHLTALGQGELLVNRKELAPFKKHAQKRITGVSYVSASFMTKANSASQQIDQAARMAEQFLPFAGLGPELEGEITADVKKLAADLKAAIPEAGAVSGFSFLSDRGVEGYSHNWGENKMLDGSKSLDILKHVGGDPLFVFAGRGVYSPESYDTFSEWVGRGLYYGEKIALQQLGDEEREFYEGVRDDLLPLLKELDQVTRDKLVPAFEDGQAALVFDAKTKSDQLHIAMPPASEALPIPELGLVYGVSDADSLQEAAQSYFHIVQRTLDILHKAEPTEIPELKLPPPEARDFPGGTIFFYRLPQQVGLDKQIAPNAGLSDKTLVLSLVPKMTVRLINESKLSATGPLADQDRPLASAFKFNFAGLLDAVAPWVDYAITVSGAEVDANITDQIATGFEIAKCLRGASGVTYKEGDAWVTHYEMHIQDLQ